MSLFKKLHNEALDEDLKAQRQVIENLKKQVNLFSGISLVKPEIGENEKYTLDKYINNFIEALNNFAGAQREGEQRQVEFSASNLMSKYNSLSLYLDNINLPFLADSDKIPIVQKLDDLIPLIKNIQRITSKLESVFDRKIIDDIAMNFENQVYKPIGARLGETAIESKKSKLFLDIKDAVESAKEVIARGNDLLTYELPQSEETRLRDYLDRINLTGLEEILTTGELKPSAKGLVRGLQKNIQGARKIIDKYEF